MTYLDRCKVDYATLTPTVEVLVEFTVASSDSAPSAPESPAATRGRLAKSIWNAGSRDSDSTLLKRRYALSVMVMKRPRASPAPLSAGGCSSEGSTTCPAKHKAIMAASCRSHS